MTASILNKHKSTPGGASQGWALAWVIIMLSSVAGSATAPKGMVTPSLPMFFEANRGQANGNAQFIARPQNGIFCLQSDGAYVTLITAEQKPVSSREEVGASMRNRTIHSRKLHLDFLGANQEARMTGRESLTGKVRYYLGNEPSAWQPAVEIFNKVDVKGIYPGIDLIYYGNDRELEYDFEVAAGTDPGQIRFEWKGAQKVELDSTGDLIVHAGERQMRQHAPVIYQVLPQGKKVVAGGYTISGAEIGFRIGEYDKKFPLVIDPVLSWAIYEGGRGSDLAWDVALDGSQNVYVAGETLSANLPVTIGGGYRGGNPNAGGDAFVAKLNSAGTLIYLTYLGGSGDDAALGIAVDSSGAAYLTGVTDSTNFPTMFALSNNISGVSSPVFHFYPFDSFVTKLDPSGALAYSTYLGGNSEDQGIGITIDSNAVVYVTGFTSSTNFPVSNAMSNRLAGASDAFVTALTAGPGGNLGMVYSTYLGGTNNDHGGGIAVTPDGIACLTGWTGSTNFPLTRSTALQPNLNNRTNATTASDAFVVRFDPSGHLLYSSFLGGSGDDTGFRITLDSDGSMYVTGSSTSTNFPVSGVLGKTHTRLTNSTSLPDVFLTKLTSAGQLSYSTVFGGTAKDEGWSVSVDAAHNAYVVGTTASTNLFVRSAPISQCSTNSGLRDAFIAAVNSDGSDFLYSFYLGGKSDDLGMGIAVDPVGNAYVVGETASANFPVTGASASFGGTNDAFIAMIGSASAPQLMLTPGPSSVTLRWLANQPQYSVQKSSDAGLTWTTIAPAPPATNGFHTVTVGVTNPFLEFRLHLN